MLDFTKFSALFIFSHPHAMKTVRVINNFSFPLQRLRLGHQQCGADNRSEHKASVPGGARPAARQAAVSDA